MTTLADLKRRGEGLSAHCGRPGLICGHHSKLDLEVLIARYGADYNIINETRIAAACKCEACGFKGAVVHIAANTITDHYRASKGQ